MLSDYIRKEAERKFHNERFGEGNDNRQHLDKWYAALAACAHKQNRLVKQYGKGCRVLEYGCADGRISLNDFDVPNDFLNFYGIDISDKAIEVANIRAASKGIANSQFAVMDAEDMTFADGHFDVVFGRGILHHLNLARCLPEIRRVLRPGGKAIFNEPLGHNPALNYYRRKTPDLRTANEHPLLMKDLRMAKSIFSKARFQFYGMTTLAGVPFRNSRIGKSMMQCCEYTDRVLLALPFIQQNAWSVLLTLTK